MLPKVTFWNVAVLANPILEEEGTQRLCAFFYSAGCVR